MSTKNATFADDMQIVQKLEDEMNKLGNRYFKLENMVQVLGHDKTAPARIGAKMDLIELQQEDINSKLHMILSKYKVYYNKNYYIVEDPEGGEYFRHDEKG